MQSTIQGTRALLLDVSVLDRVQARDERQKLEATLIAKAKSNQGTVHAPAPMPTQVTVKVLQSMCLYLTGQGYEAPAEGGLPVAVPPQAMVLLARLMRLLTQ